MNVTRLGHCACLLALSGCGGNGDVSAAGPAGGRGGAATAGSSAGETAGTPGVAGLVGFTGGAGPGMSGGGSTNSAGSGATAGRTEGGSSNGGAAGIGASSGAAGDSAVASALDFSYWLGVDISYSGTQPEATRANLLALLKAHGINSVRLRTFVDPTAADGYNKSGACDLAHTIDFGKQIKAAGMGLLVDFHYSDNWADPGKQCVPIKWQSYSNITQLASAVHDYTKDAITQLSAGGARPDMVQIGNETTPGMLIHRCDSSGQPIGTNPINGSTSNWADLGALLKAGVAGVKEVDPTILTSFHIDKGGDHADGQSALATSVTWLTNALKYTPVDAFGESCYQTYQGDTSSAAHSKMIWSTVEGGIAAEFPNVKIFAAEYGGAIREINDVIYNLPKQQGLGTFFWEATMANSSWNNGALVSQSGNTYAPQPDLSLYDQMQMDYASRL